VREPYRGYREILADSLAELAGEQGWRWNERDGEAMARAMESWQPFPDTVPALRAARDAGLGLWIISNTDRAIIEHSLGHMDIEFDGVTVAQDCRAYKPSDEPFDRALEDIGRPPEEILHVAFGFKYDIAPAQRQGMPTAWVNRRQEAAPGVERPDHEWRDLWPLAELAGA
jgi:2-haloacid dehalogenase